jgi:hypothetical protein
MNVVLLLSAVIAALVAAFLFVRAISGGFRAWKLSEKVAVAQIFLPFGAAAFALNALFGDSLATSSKIVAAIFTLLAGSLAIVKQVAATMESHASGLEEAAPIEPVSLGGVLSKLISG